MKGRIALAVACALNLWLLPVALRADDAAEPIAAAILPFAERGSGTEGMGAKVADILFAALVADPDLYLVDREDFEKTLAEAELNASGAVDPNQAVQIGQLTGARLLVTGSVVEADTALYLVAKVIGTETTKVAGAKVKGHTGDELAPLVEELAVTLAETIKAKAGTLVAPRASPADAAAALREQMPEGPRPAVLVRIAEQHLGQQAIDPAAETEIALLCKETGFELIDAEEGREGQADVVISGEAFSEFGGRLRNLVSVKARVEVKAVDRRSGRVLAVDRQTALAVDLAELVAGKTALQRAAAQLAQRLLPKVVAEYQQAEAGE